MSRALGLRWSRHPGQQAGSAARFCAALWLVFYIACTPIHLYLEPHCDDAHRENGGASARHVDCVAVETHRSDGAHERHPAAQHKFKVTQPTRAVVAEMMPVQAMEWVDRHEGCPQPQGIEFSGLSPPELPRAWQFLLRTALPVRAPSLLS